MSFNKTLIIGLGLIGGSFAKSLRQNQLSKQIFACDLDLETLELAQEEKVIDGITFLEEGVADFDFIVIAAPLSAYEDIFDDISPSLNPEAIVIDLGSVKDFDMESLPQNFIPCHPIAGSENSGFEHSTADLFSGRKFIICSENPKRNKVAEVAKKLGSEVEFMSGEKHDEIFALVSHLPQFLSFLTLEFSPKNIEDEFFKKAFRLDDSSPELWEDIFEINEENLEKFYLVFFDELERAVENLYSKSTDVVPSEGFFAENFAAIFFRVLVVQSYLKIPEIKAYAKHAGQGFKDFTSIIEVLNYDQKLLDGLIRKNHSKIHNFFREIS